MMKQVINQTRSVRHFRKRTNLAIMSLMLTFLKQKWEDIGPFCLATDTPVWVTCALGFKTRVQ